MLLTPTTGIGITKQLLPNSVPSSKKRLLLAFDFLFEEDYTLAQRNMLRLGYKRNTPDDVDVIFILRDPYNNAQDRLFTEEQETYHDMFSMGRTTQERLYSHGLGPSSALFPQDITNLLGQRLPKYDFIVQTSAPTVVNIKNLLTTLDSLNASQPLYAFHKGSNTAIMTSQFAQTVHISKELFNTLEGLQSYAKPEFIVNLDSNLFAPCNADFKKPIGFLENCNTIDLKLEAFRKMDYMAKDTNQQSSLKANDSQFTMTVMKPIVISSMLVVAALILIVVSFSVFKPGPYRRHQVIGLKQTQQQFRSLESKATTLSPVKMLLTPTTGIGITKQLLPNSVPSSKKRLLLALDFLFEEDNTLAQRNMLRLGYKGNTPDDVDVIFILRDPYNNAQDRLFTEEQETHHDIFSMGRTTQERLYSHGLGPSSALFPQDITNLLGQRLPKYDFIVQTSAPTVVNIKNLLATLDSLNASQPLYAFHKGSNTAIMTSQFAQTVHISKELFNTLEGLQSYAKPEFIVNLDSNLFTQCNDGFKNHIGFFENCNTIDLKLDTFKKMAYLTESDVSFSGNSTNRLVSTSPNQERKLLYGIFTYYSDRTTQRRILMRFVYNKLLNAAGRGVDVRFIFGIPKTEAEKRLILEEQKKYGDIIVIDAPEAMNEGKSFYYIQQTVGMMDNGTLPNYQFIAKGDDDMLLNLRGVMDKLAEYDPNEIVYFGRSHPTKFENFGMTYGFSITLARKIAAETPDEASLRSYEDFVMGGIVVKVANDTKTTWNFIDDRPQYGGWAIPVTKEVLGVHNLKDTNSIWNHLMMFETLYAFN